MRPWPWWPSCAWPIPPKPTPPAGALDALPTAESSELAPRVRRPKPHELVETEPPLPPDDEYEPPYDDDAPATELLPPPYPISLPLPFAKSSSSPSRMLRAHKTGPF